VIDGVVLHPYEDVVTVDNSAEQGTTRTTTADMPTSSFKRYTTKSTTLLGKVFSFLGDRSVKHHVFMDKHRVNGSLYSYNYLVYHETGTFVSMSKKRGGFFKRINGWKDIKADELFMQYKGLVLEMNLDMPSGLSMPSSTQKPVVDSYSDMSIEGLDNVVHKTVNILGYNVREKDLYKYIGKGAKQVYNILKEKVDNPQLLKEYYGTDGSIPAIRIITPNKVYVVITDATFNPKNEKKLRKVFSSGVKILISISHANFSWGDVLKSVQGTQKLPVKKLIGGEVLLAGKLNGKWGGMYIEKIEE